MNIGPTRGFASGYCSTRNDRLAGSNSNFLIFCRTNRNSNPHCKVTDLELRVAMPTNLQKARELFLHAVGNLPPEKWEGYVSDACSGDADLEQQVRCLLQVHREAGSFLEAPAPGLDATLNQPLLEKPGTQIGPYKLLQQIGEGGMGV